MHAPGVQNGSLPTLREGGKREERVRKGGRKEEKEGEKMERDEGVDRMVALH